MSRYDGYSFKVYENEPFNRNSLSHNLIQTMYLDTGAPDAAEILWLGTYGGLNRFDMATEEFRTYRNKADDISSLSNDVVVSIFRDSKKRLWIGTLQGLNLFSEESGTFTRYIHDPLDPASLPGNSVRAILEDRDGNLWIATSPGGLARLREDGGFEVLRHNPERKESLLSDNVMALALDYEGRMWVGTWGGGLSLFHPETRSFDHYPTGDERVYVINTQEPGLILAGTWGGGLFEFDMKTKGFSEYKQDDTDGSLSHNIVYSMLIDSAGELWVGTNGGGVNHMNRIRKSYTVYAHNPKYPLYLPSGKVTAVIEDHMGRLWIGSYNGGVSRYDEETGNMVRYMNDPKNPRSLSGNVVTAMYEDSLKNLWVMTTGGLSRYIPSIDAFENFYADEGKPESLSDSIVYCMLEDERTNLWIGTYTAGLEYYDRAAGRFRHFRSDPLDPETLSDNLIYALSYDAKGRLWVGTNNGLNRYENGKFTRYFHDPDNLFSVPANTVRILFLDSQSVLWVGTSGGGLARYDEASDSFIHFTKKEGMPSNSVVGILEDGQGNLWVSTQHGLTVYDKKTGQFRTLTVQNDLREKEFHTGRFKGRNGELYFGGMSALYRFNPQAIEHNTHIPPIHITSVRILNQERKFDRQIYLMDSIRISYSENYISFTFAALDYRDPDKNQYAYKLEGFDSDWVYCGARHTASYTNLPGGTYTFRVKGSNNDGLWNETGTSLAVRVSRPPWLTAYAFAFYVLVLVVSVYALATRRSKIELAHKVSELLEVKEALEKANAELARLSTIDGLTGLPNRRKLDEELSQRLAAAKRERHDLSILMLDLDFFKRYNDHYGHGKGDDCLKRISSALTSALERTTDFVARYGGEEFLIILPYTDRAGAATVAERIRRVVESLNIPHQSSEVSPFVTISIGIISVLPGPDQRVDGLLHDVDEALYRAKQNGRNRTSF